MKYIKFFKDLGLKDVKRVGGKNASLGQMIRSLSKYNIEVPHGFALTADAYWYVIKYNKLLPKLKQCLKPVSSTRNIKVLRKAGTCARRMIENAEFPKDLIDEINAAYKKLSKQYNVKQCDVAVRSSATAEDSPEASFAGQQETFLHVVGTKQLLESCKKSIASLFTDRAIAYRIEKGFDHFDMALSVGVQKMVRADKASSGVSFSLDTESGFKDVVVINATYGLGETLVQGRVIPDEFHVFKPLINGKYKPIIQKQLGQKHIKQVYAVRGKKQTLKDVRVAKKDQNIFSLTDKEILEVARATSMIEQHYTKHYKRWMPMDVEWAKDGRDGKIYVLQARPETVHSNVKQTATFERYILKNKKPNILVTGQSIGQKIASGRAKVITSSKSMNLVKKGDVIVTHMTDPDWVPVMKLASAIVATRGGTTAHAAIVSRELGIPALVGAIDAMKKIKNGQIVTVDCSQGKTGYVYNGKVAFTKEKVLLKKIKKPKIDLMINLGTPDRAYTLSRLPVDGVGLARIEFIIADKICIHPMALVHPNKVENKSARKKIDTLTHAYKDKKTFFVERLAQEVGTIAAAFYPRPVLVRFSDFKSNEYRNLIGGDCFEPHEANPMLGLRGASRYYSTLYREAFALECAAMKYVRETIGLKNINLMIPFVRTVNDAKAVLKELKRHGLSSKKDLKLFMMCELPSNVLEFEQFSKLFDGFSIGSNDLTQLTLGIDRDSELIAPLFDERANSVKALLSLAIKSSKKHKSYIGICGQAPSDYPDLARWLIKEGIDSISLNDDTVIPFLQKK